MGKGFQFRLSPVLKKLHYQCTQIKKKYTEAFLKQEEIKKRLLELDKNAHALIESVIQLRSQGLFEKGELLIEVYQEKNREIEALNEQLIQQQGDLEELKEKLREHLQQKKRVETLLANAYAEWVKKQTLHEEHLT